MRLDRYEAPRSPEEDDLNLHAKHVFEEFMDRDKGGVPYISLDHLAKLRLARMEYPEDEISQLAAQIVGKIMETHKDEVDEVVRKATPPYSLQR